MSFRTMIVFAGLATLAGGCAIEPRQHDDRGYRYEPRVYRDTDSYQGYFYFRVIYISGIPWYVDDYRRVRPIPPHLHSHFRDASWARSLPPRFGRDRVVRDGYDLSRIVYINNVPHYVDDDRRARPMPDQVRNRFDYRVVVPQQGADRRGDDRRGDDRRGDDRSPYPQRYDGREARSVQPVYGREQDRKEPPAYGRERDSQPAQGRELERQENRAYERERDRRAPPVVRDERNAPPAQAREQPSERGSSRDEGRPTSQDRGRKGDEPRAEPAAERKNGKAPGRGRDRGEDEGEEGKEGKDSNGNARDVRKYRGE
ncbi:MAG: hypothetical protein R6W97_10110 [Thiobacillus sp.]